MKRWINSQHLSLSWLLDLCTFQGLSVELPLLDEPSKHLRLHENLQETAHSLRWDGFTETLPLEGAGDRGGG